MPRLRSRILFKAISPVIVILVSAAGRADSAAAEACAHQRGGMVATACPEATAVGVKVLEAGGNAVDAAVAVGFALAVAYPKAGNIGGGGFMLVRSSDGKTCFLDFREKAPSGADRDMYLDAGGAVIEDLSVRGHLASGVPGTVAGMWKAHQMYGTMDWGDLLRPSIELAREGFAVGPYLAASLAELKGQMDNWPGLAKFFGEAGMPLEEGESLVQPLLAETLQRIAERGRDGFYTGETARLIADEMSIGGGLITIEDLAAYEVVERDALTGSYRGHVIISAPPPSSGGTALLEILNILEGYGPQLERCEETIHRVVESERRAYADRARWLGDTDYVEAPIARLISKSYAEELRNGIADHATPSAELDTDTAPAAEREQTTHYSIIDADGNAVAVTTTLNDSYGSYVVVRGAGFLMNNEMDDFSVKPGVPNMYGLTGGKANAIAPGKRMLSSMTPTMVLEDGRTWIVLGTPGGSTIITTVAQVIVDIVDYGMAPLDAVAAARYHHQWSPDLLYHERGAFTPEEAQGLKRRGHVLKERKPIGDVQLIIVGRDGAVGVSDPRWGGKASAAGGEANGEKQGKEH